MADSRTLTKRKFRIEEPNPYGANYVVRSIEYEPLFKNIYGDVIYEAGYYLDISPQHLKLEQGGHIMSSGAYDVFKGIPGREQTFLMPANRFNAKTAEKVVAQYKDISYIQEYCDRHGLKLAMSDPDDEAVNSPGFNWEYRTGGIYRYPNMDVKGGSSGKSYQKLVYGESTPKEELTGRFVECMNRIMQETKREVFTEDEIVMMSSLDYMLLRPSEAKMMVRDAISKGYLVKRGDYIRITEKSFDSENQVFFMPETKKAPTKKMPSKCTKPMVKSIPKKPTTKKAPSKDLKSAVGKKPVKKAPAKKVTPRRK